MIVHLLTAFVGFCVGAAVAIVVIAQRHEPQPRARVARFNRRRRAPVIAIADLGATDRQRLIAAVWTRHGKDLPS